MAKSVFTCFQILKPTMNKWAQCPAQMEVKLRKYRVSDCSFSPLSARVSAIIAQL